MVDPPGAVGSSKVKLPKISLPHFKGNLVYWTAFWDSYESAVHLNRALSDVDKFNYLRSLSENSSSANYAEAIEILKRRFGNRDVIVSRHMELLLNLTSVLENTTFEGCDDYTTTLRLTFEVSRHLGWSRARTVPCSRPFCFPSCHRNSDCLLPERCQVRL